jgi:glucokinase
MIVLADIGGTFARFALAAKNGGFESLKTLRAADFASLEEALALYAAEMRLPEKADLLIATAAYEDGPVWRFVNANRWVIDPAALERGGWHVQLILNDFAAATGGLAKLAPEHYEVIRAGRANAALPRCLAGPGTGLGLGFLLPLADGGTHVQRTHGGHMLVAALTPEQWDVIQAVQALKAAKTIPVFENFVSGPGLLNIYTALCVVRGKSPEATTTEQLLGLAETVEAREALRLFHEFFGLFCATAVITGHAYGGLHLTGGMLERLAARGLFDAAHFLKFFSVRGVDSVHAALELTPVVRITHPALALEGLLRAEKARRNA